MKTEQREQARKLRIEEGLSLKAISKKIGVAKSSVSLWVRDIELTESQNNKLYERNVFSIGGDGWKKQSEIFREKRRKFQEKGKEDAQKNDILHSIGCSLFWAEGTKRNNSIIFTNSDPDMMTIFLKFLKECFQINRDDIKLEIFCYIDNGLTSEQIEKYWLELLELPETCLNKTQINKISKYSYKKRKNKLNYGICKLIVHNTELNQRVYGAIKHYADIKDSDKWLF